MSEVARLRRQIEQEHAASTWALSGLAEGTARHDFIQRRLEHMSIAHDGLSALLGEEQAAAVVCEIVDATAQSERKEAHNALARQDKPPCLTTITVRLRPGQAEKFDEKLKEICRESKHLLPGTTARYIARSQANPEEMHIVLIWRNGVQPRERGKALRGLFADLDELLDWQTASGRDYLVICEA